MLADLAKLLTKTSVVHDGPDAGDDAGDEARIETEVEADILAAADRALHDCVDQVGEPAIATLMLAGVRIGGTPYLPTRFRWGYGWPWPRGYRALTPAELDQSRQYRELP